MEAEAANNIATAVMKALDADSFLVFEPDASITDIINALDIDKVVADLEERGFLVFVPEVSIESITDASRDQDFLIWHPSDSVACVLEDLLTWDEEATISAMINALRDNDFVVAGPTEAEESE